MVNSRKFKVNIIIDSYTLLKEIGGSKSMASEAEGRAFESPLAYQ